jgi:hypothetical protein
MAIPPILKGSILNDSYYTPSAARVQPENGRKQKDVIRHHVVEFFRIVESAKKNENQTFVFTFHDLYGIIPIVSANKHIQIGRKRRHEIAEDPPAPGAVLRAAGRVRKKGGAGRLGGL